jgi:hypothetical protein
MKYLLAIYDDERRWPGLDEAEQKAEIDAYWALDREAQERGAFIASQALEPSQATTIVRVRNGETIVTDGPFAETKEQLGGFYLLECEGHDEALEWAKKVPAAGTGYVEVRPVVEFEAPAPAGADAAQGRT